MGKKLNYALQYFAKEGPGGEKTEQPTAKKLRDARKEGQVAKSTELNMAVTLLGLFLLLKFMVGKIGENLLESYHFFWNQFANVVREEFTLQTGMRFLKESIQVIIQTAGFIFIFTMIVVVLINVWQVKWRPTTKPLAPKFSKLNPIKGFRKIISKEKLMDFLKSVLKIAVIIYILYTALKDDWPLLLSLYELSFFGAIQLIGSTVIQLGIKISLFFLIIGIMDLFYQRIKFKNDMKMTKQEVKDEYKNTEGDPQIKGKIRGKMREASQKRMMQALPKADVVITNPTHLAVAIQYDKEKNAAPVVIAKGADYIAQKIKEIAKENKIEIVENKPLARMLYYNVDLNCEIPQELYQMVAEVLAYVYSLKKKK